MPKLTPVEIRQLQEVIDEIRCTFHTQESLYSFVVYMATAIVEAR